MPGGDNNSKKIDGVERSKLSLREHLHELRKRVLLVVAVFLIASGAAYLVRQQATGLIIKPLHQAIYYNTPQGGFEFFMRVVITLGFIAIIPVLSYQLMRFAEPALGTKLSPKFLRSLMLRSLVLLLGGVAFGYLIILPTTLKFFAGFGTAQIKPLISANDYLNMVLGVLATFALIFQLPLVIRVIDHIKPLKPQQLTRYRRHVIVGSLILALVLPFTYDPITQFVMAVPIVVLYEMAIFTVWSRQRKQLRAVAMNKRREAKAQHNKEKALAKKPAEQPQPQQVFAPSPAQPLRSVDSLRTRVAPTLDLRAFS